MRELARQDEGDGLETAVRMRAERQAAIARRIDLRAVMVQEQERIDLLDVAARHGPPRREIGDVVAHRGMRRLMVFESCCTPLRPKALVGGRQHTAPRAAWHAALQQFFRASAQRAWLECAHRQSLEAGVRLEEVDVALPVAGLAAAVAPAVNAHFKLLEPASWLVEDDRGDPQKLAPCGGTLADPGEPTGAVTAVTGGSKLKIVVNETIFHPGHYRIALARKRNALPPDPVRHDARHGARPALAVRLDRDERRSRR